MMKADCKCRTALVFALLAVVLAIFPSLGWAAAKKNGGFS